MQPYSDPTQSDNLFLGKTDIQISALGVGGWAWGDRLFWGFGRTHQETDVQDAIQASLDGGINLIDTAEVYGQGQSEKFIGSYFKTVSKPVVIATKFMPFPWRLSRSSLLRALKNSQKRLDRAPLDLYQIHWAFPPRPVAYWSEALAAALDQGLIRAAGVSNYNASQTYTAHDVLTRHGFSLASNQLEYNLLDRRIERNGVLKACQEIGATVIAYSPLAKGALTGKYTPEKQMHGIRGQMYNRATLVKIQPLIRLLREIGRAHDGKTPAQVSLNWLICKGAVPIPGAKNARQANENAGALGWRLTGDEIQALDHTSQEVMI